MGVKQYLKVYFTIKIQHKIRDKLLIHNYAQYFYVFHFIIVLADLAVPLSLQECAKLNKST